MQRGLKKTIDMNKKYIEQILIRLLQQLDRDYRVSACSLGCKIKKEKKNM